MNRSMKICSTIALVALLAGCGNPAEDSTPSQSPATSASSSPATSASSSPVSSSSTTEPSSSNTPTSSSPSPTTPTNTSATPAPTISTEPTPNPQTASSVQPTGQPEEPSANPSWCNPQGGPGSQHIDSCPEVPEYHNIVNNEQEAAQYILREKFQNNPDITTAVTQVLQDSQGGVGQYVVVARSQSLRQGGGSGTLGTFLVTPKGSWAEADPAMIPQNG